MADEIIDFYKKAKEPEEPQKPIEEQKETPVPEIPKPDEPFDRFLLELAEKLQKEKVITEKQQETFVEQIKEPVSTDPNENDPFKKFIGSFANILKEDELVNREENIKEATINFINKLKEQPDEPFIIQDEVIVQPKLKKYLPPKIAKKVQKLPQPLKKEEPVVAEQADEPVKEETKEENTYVKELKTTDKTNKKIPEKIKSVSDIKSIVEKQVAEILSRYPNLGFTGGGGGTNAVQYAEGGTMNGNLTVNGTVNATTYLSGGVNLYNLLSSSGGGGGAADRLVSGSESLILNPDGTLEFPNDTIRPPDETILTLESENPALSSYTRVALSPYAFFAYDNEGNSITFDEVDNAIVLTSQDLYEWTFNSEGKLIGPSGTLAVSGNIDASNKILSGGVDLADIFITSAEESQTLAYDTQTELLSITRGNSISLSSLSDKSYANSNFLKLSGGTISGNLTIQGNISALGTATFANTIFTTTSALSVVNTGPGPALYVYQAAGPYDVASFYDGDGIEVLHVGNAGPGGFGKVGVNESFPNEELTVRGSISATETIFAFEGNSNQWNSAYTTLQSGSANYILQGGNTFSIPLTVGTNNNQSLVLETGGTNRVTILSSGQVGIGTTNPNSTLTVSGAISSTGNITSRGGTLVIGNVSLVDQSLTGQLSIGSYYFQGGFFNAPAANAIGWGTSLGVQDTRIWRDGAANIVALRNDLNPQTFRIYNTYTAGTPVSSEFSYTRWSNNTFQIGTSSTGGGQNRNIVFQTVGTTRMSVTSAGNIGIGTTTPNERLTVVGDVSASGIVYASEGNSNVWNRPNNVWIPAAAWIPRTTNGCGVDSRELSTSNFDELLFDPGTNEFAQALYIMPNNYNFGTVTARFYWTASTGVTGSVVWGLQGSALSDSNMLSAITGTPQTVTDTLLSANRMHVTSATPAITIAGTPAANTPIQFQIYRDAVNVSDDYTFDARLLGVEILYNQ